jgi:hypothetical protein
MPGTNFPGMYSFDITTESVSSPTVHRLAIGRRVYSTNFPLTENPISEGGKWINGGTTGLDWSDVRTSPGLAFGATSTTTTPPFNDPTAVLSGTWGPIQECEGVVVVPASPADYQELELRLRTTVAAHAILGYEAIFSVTANPYVQVVRWDGGTTIDKFVYIADATGPRLNTGDRVRANVDASHVFRAWVNQGTGWQLIATSTPDATYQGNPGMGAWNHTALPFNFGFSSLSARAM